MKVLITGACGFVGGTLTRYLLEIESGFSVLGMDNLIRPGSEQNRAELSKLGLALHHGDIRAASDIESLPAADWVIDASANPSVLAVVDGKMSSRQLIEHNLLGTVNLLEYCRKHKAGFILLSTSRVYSIRSLAVLDVEVHGEAFRPRQGAPWPSGLTEQGISEGFSTEAPLSLYGCSKLASEILALEYGEMFGFPVWINRCGVLAGAGQFGRADQGIFAFWINAYLRRKPLTFIGFGGKGYQVRDCMHPLDLVPLLKKQMEGDPPPCAPRTINLGGGQSRAISLAELSGWCRSRFGPHPIESDRPQRPFDVPWMVMDSSLAHATWSWKPERSLEAILTEIAEHAEKHPNWLEISGLR
jgi:CDP-paratose 2-epimerase